MQFLRLVIIGLFGWTVVLLGAEYTLRNNAHVHNSLALWELRQKLVIPHPQTVWAWRTSQQLPPAQQTTLPISWTSSVDGTKRQLLNTQLAAYRQQTQVIVMGDESVWGLGQQSGLTLVDYLQLQYGPTEKTGIELINAGRPYGCPGSCQLFFRKWLSEQTGQYSRIVILVLSPEMLQTQQKLRQNVIFDEVDAPLECGPLPPQIPIPDPPAPMQQWLVVDWLKSEVESRLWNALISNDTPQQQTFDSTLDHSVYDWATPLVPAIAQFASELQQNNIPLVIAMPPATRSDDPFDPDQSKQLWQQLHSRTNVTLVPLLPPNADGDLMDASRSWWSAEGLLTEAGHQEVAYQLISPLQSTLNQLPSTKPVTNLATSPETAPETPAPKSNMIR